MLKLPAQLACDAPELLRVSGRDMVDLLQRIAASDVRDLAIGATQRVLFTDDKGRIVDLPLLWRDEECAWLLAGEGRAALLAAWLRRWVIREDVRVEWPQAQGAWLRQGTTPADETLSLRQDELPILSRQELRALWIRAGIYRPGPKLDWALHPLEVGLRSHVSFDKGCYIGQEVIARMDTYEKVRRALAWLSGAGTPQAGAAIHRGAESGRVLCCLLEPERYLALVQAPRSWAEGERVEVDGAAEGTLGWVPEGEAVSWA